MPKELHTKLRETKELGGSCCTGADFRGSIPGAARLAALIGMVPIKVGRATVAHP